jgi:hypothetical protein
MLELLRKIFGCYHDNTLDYVTTYKYNEELKEHTFFFSELFSSCVYINM